MKDNKAITLIVLIITIVIMLILVGVGIKIAMDGELIGTTESAVNEWNDKVDDYKNKTDEALGKLDEEMEENLEICSHSYGSWTITTAANCTTAGIQVGECNTCKKVETQPIAALGHNWVNGVCSRCGIKCEHTYVDGTCTICNCECDHALILFTTGVWTLSGGELSGASTYHYHSCECGEATVIYEHNTWVINGPLTCPLCSYEEAWEIPGQDGRMLLRSLPIV